MPRRKIPEGPIFELHALSLMALSAIILTPVSAKAQAYDFTTIDWPGAQTTELNGVSLSMTGALSHISIVGSYSDVGGSHGFEYANGKFTAIPAPTNGSNVQALGIGNGGQIVGTYKMGNLGQPFVLTGGPTGAMTGITTCAGGNVDVEAYGINNNGDMVLSYLNNQNVPITDRDGLFLGKNGPCVQISASNTQTITYGLNDSGYTVSSYQDKNKNSHGYIFKTTAQPATMDVPRATQTWLRGINNQNVIVGYYLDGATKHGFVHEPSGAGTFYTVDVPGAESTEVHGISNPGSLTGTLSIVGIYVSNDGVQHGFAASFKVPVANAPPFTGVAITGKTPVANAPQR
jgi:hypothetical protein